MKRTFTIFFALFVALCAKQGYDFITVKETKSCLLSGYLSDIADEVVSIPLQNSKEHTIRYAKQVQQEGNNLFLVCNEILYRFNRRGELIGAVTNPAMIRVEGYLIEPRKRQLIVFGNEDDIHYYTFNGELLETKKLKSSISGERICSMAMHNNTIWTTEEYISYDPDTNQIRLEIVAVNYDTSFTKIESRKIMPADVGREQGITTCLDGEVCVNRDSGTIYIYNPPLAAEFLMRDTLYIRHHFRQPDQVYIPAYPTRIGSRFWLSACENNSPPLQNFLFCFDTHSNKIWQLSNGFEDDYYGTGNVTNLHPMDMHNRNYYFCKYADELTRCSDLDIQGENVVVFLVKLKA